MSIGNDPVTVKTDKELLLAWTARRDESAFRTLIERHGALLTGVAKRRLTEPDLAPDIAGRAFALLAQKPQKVSRDEVAGWLVRVTVHLCNTENRGTRRRLARETTANHEFARNQTQMNSAKEDLSHTIDELLLSLSSADRECLLLHTAEGLTHKEVADRMGVTEDAVRMRTNRAIDRIRRRLGLSASGIVPVLKQYEVVSLSPSEESRIVQAALYAPAPAIGSISLRWILMTNAQRITLAIASSFLFVAVIGAAVSSQRASSSKATLPMPELKAFEGKWRGTLTYVVRRTGRKVNMPATSEVNANPNGFRLRVSYGDPKWSVDAKVQVLPKTQQLVYEDKEVRQDFKLIASDKNRFSGQRFVDEPGRPRDERITFLREGDRFTVLIEERLKNADWIFANEHRMEVAR